MANRTELARLIDRYELTPGVGLGMAFHTLVEAMLDVPVALTHGEITVVLEKIHMLLAHNVRGLNTHVTFTSGHFRHVGQ